MDLCQRLRQAGGRILSDARLRSVHFGDPSTLQALFRGELWRGRDNIRVSLRRPLVVRDVLSLSIAVFQLLCLVSIPAGLLLLLAGGPGGRIALVGVAGSALLTLLQSARMLRQGSLHPADLVQVPVVACLYGAARALALIVRVSYQVRQGGSRA